MSKPTKFAEPNSASKHMNRLSLRSLFKVTWNVWSGERVHGPGIYVLCATTPLAKILGEDPAGILYVGQARNLYARLGRKRAGKHDHHVFWHVLGKKQQGHSYEWTFPKLSATKGANLRAQKWRVVLVYHSISVEQRKQSPLDEWEQAFLAMHSLQFGQFPPLNTKNLSLNFLERWKPFFSDPLNRDYFTDAQKQIRSLVR